MLGQKENFMTVLRGGCPDDVPTYHALTSGESRPNTVLLLPPFLTAHRQAGRGGRDIWGVDYVPTASTAGATMPAPGRYILDDVRRWRDVIRAPDLSGFDWAGMARRHLEAAQVDRSVTTVSLDLHFGYFQHLMAFMGFENGLLALYEEPEECRALLDYLSRFYLTVLENVIDHYRPDILAIKDDTAAEHAPFLSLEMYRSIFLPLYDRQAAYGRNRGLPISFHLCGKCELYLEDLVGIGVTLWEPAQTSNNLAAIKRRFGNRLVIAGGWEPRGRLLEADVTDEEIARSVRDTIYTLAPGGGYCFCGGYFGLAGDADSQHRTQVVNETYLQCRAAVYDRG